jgi:hypothetical protein
MSSDLADLKRLKVTPETRAWLTARADQATAGVSGLETTLQSRRRPHHAPAFCGVGDTFKRAGGTISTPPTTCPSTVIDPASQRVIACAAVSP